jgi:hypothetical protein
MSNMIEKKRVQERTLLVRKGHPTVGESPIFTAEVAGFLNTRPPCYLRPDENRLYRQRRRGKHHGRREHIQSELFGAAAEIGEGPWWS